ncbi:cupin domain-containing protein [Streptomyces rectiverticillatus]|uniref:cupin domain-containing protein n=1 Tax=Streptomyces rectiverticillatus TaxID=173860 RepID=UPI0015C34256|nr:cupin domain-containing protein [Streptomyces rectiverticillatus]QLE70840.1 cupin domain-containing protein [Streptomyces rectiverticillatus]
MADSTSGSTSGISELVALLGLQPHVEGGWFRETWKTSREAVPDGYGGPRAFATGIYYLLHPGEVSRWHRVRSDELWLWHRGGPLRMRLGGSGDRPDGKEASEVVVGPGVERGEQPQFLVPGGVWQSAEPAGDEPVLVTCVVAPGFDYEDFEDSVDSEDPARG